MAQDPGEPLFVPESVSVNPDARSRNPFSEKEFLMEGIMTWKLNAPWRAVRTMPEGWLRLAGRDGKISPCSVRIVWPSDDGSGKNEAFRSSLCHLAFGVPPEVGSGEGYRLTGEIAVTVSRTIKETSAVPLDLKKGAEAVVKEGVVLRVRDTWPCRRKMYVWERLKKKMAGRKAVRKEPEKMVALWQPDHMGIKDVWFTDGEGAAVPFRCRGTSCFGGDRDNQEWFYLFPRSVRRAYVHARMWDDLQTVKVPVDFPVQIRERKKAD